MAKIKICGLRCEQDIAFANELKPDYVGFILTAGFRRSINFETAEMLKYGLNSEIKAVGVFVDENIDFVNKFVKKGIIDVVQLHGKESPKYCSEINAPVIKALMLKDFDKVQVYEPFVDYFLFDSGTGSGKAFDWNLIPKTENPFFLAGGLSADNIENAINNVKPFAVDLSSSVETNGFKDFNKIKTVMEIVK